MSSELVVALVAVITTGVIGIAGLVFNFWNSSSERRQRLAEREQDYREWYRRTVFEKRLRAAQEAYAWWRQLNVAVAEAYDNDDPNSEKRKSVRDLAERAREWYDGNSLYLEGELTGESLFVGLTNSAHAWARGQRDIKIQPSLIDVRKFVQNLANRLLAAETTTADVIS